MWIDILESESPGFDPPPAWQELGPDELPVLIKALELHDNMFQAAYRKAYYRIRRTLPAWVLRRLPRVRNTEDIGINALLFLQTLRGRQSNVTIDLRPAIPALIHTLKTNKSSTVKGMAAMVLGQIAQGNKAAAEALIAAANEKDNVLQLRAKEALKWVDPAAAAKAGVK